MGKLNQVIAVVAGKKTKATQTITEAYHLIQKQGLMDGISRVYSPKDEDGERLPPESKTMQTSTSQLIDKVREALVEVYDTVATQDSTNCRATANIQVNGTPLLKDVPVTHLLFLEKQLVDLSTFIGKLPTLDPAEKWTYDPQSDSYATPSSETVRTKKIPKAFVKYEATKEHPAQVDVFTEDVLVGYWKTVKFSGAIPAQEKNAMLERVRQLHEAVVKAREEANSIDVTEVREGSVLLDFVFKGA